MRSDTNRFVDCNPLHTPWTVNESCEWTVNESCHTYEWVVSCHWMSHVAHMNESFCTYEWVVSHIWTSHVTRMNELCHTYEWVMSHIWMSHLLSSASVCVCVCVYVRVCLNVTPVAGRIFETKNRAIFLERFFGRGISGEAIIVYNFVPFNWLWSGFIYPRIGTFVEKRFHGLFSKKMRSKSGGVPSFPRREHVLEVNSLPSK